MNSQTSWGIIVRNKILTFVRKNGTATRKQIIENCGKESANQISKLVERGQLVRLKRGVYKFEPVAVKVF